MVLLSNHNHALPLSASTSSIAVVGPLADDALDQLGPDVPIGYDTRRADLQPRPTRSSRCCRGSRTLVRRDNVNYAPGLRPTFTVTDPCTSTTGFGAAVAAAQASDVTVVVVGEPAG